MPSLPRIQVTSLPPTSLQSQLPSDGHSDIFCYHGSSRFTVPWESVLLFHQRPLLNGTATIPPRESRLVLPSIESHYSFLPSPRCCAHLSQSNWFRFVCFRPSPMPWYNASSSHSLPPRRLGPICKVRVVIQYHFPPHME